MLCAMQGITEGMYSTWQFNFLLTLPLFFFTYKSLYLCPLAVNVYRALDFLLSCLQREKCLVECSSQRRGSWKAWSRFDSLVATVVMTSTSPSILSALQAKKSCAVDINDWYSTQWCNICVNLKQSGENTSPLAQSSCFWALENEEEQGCKWSS